MTHSTSPPDEKCPDYTRDFAEVYLAELDYVAERREKIGFPKESVKNVDSESERVREELSRCQELETGQASKASKGSCQTSNKEIPPQGVLKTLISWFLWPMKKIGQILFEGSPETSTTPLSNVKPNADTGLIGLALSGGGVRSATFNLGLLQSLAKNKVLQYCDYLSTVSGGGYIGSCLSSLLANNAEASTTPQTFPLANKREDENERAEVNHLRATKDYLKSGGLFKLDTWDMIGTMISSMVLMGVIPLAAVLLIVIGLYYWNTSLVTSILIEPYLPFIAILVLVWMAGIRFRQVTSSFLVEKAFALIGWALSLTLLMVALLFLFIFLLPVFGNKWGIIVAGVVIAVWIIAQFRYSSVRYLHERIAHRALVVGLLVLLLLLVGFINHLANAWYDAWLTDYSYLYWLFGVFILAIVGVGFIVYNQFKQHFLNILTAMVLTVLLITSCSGLLAYLLYVAQYDQSATFINKVVNNNELMMDKDNKDKGWEKLRQSILSIGVVKFKYITFYMKEQHTDWGENEIIESYVPSNEPLFSLEGFQSWTPSSRQCSPENEVFLKQLKEAVKAEKHWRIQKDKTPALPSSLNWFSEERIFSQKKYIWFSAEDLEQWFQSIVVIAYYHCDHLKLNDVLKVLTEDVDKVMKIWKESYDNLAFQNQDNISPELKLIVGSLLEDLIWLILYSEQMGSSTVSKKLLDMIWVVVVLLLLIGLFTNINRNSLHDFYRNRLSRTYLIRLGKDKKKKVVEPNPSVLIRDIHQCCNGPYHLINTTLNIPSSTNRSLQGRGADFFMFSKYYCGAESTGYRRTNNYDQGQTELATAMAISGAAASPQMGTSSSLIKGLVMTLLNIRLNQWMPNPNRKRPPWLTIWLTYLNKEFLRKGEEKDAFLNLSDGGHHENLGIYPLLKRRCKLIIASDAGADPNYQMEDFANLQRKARIDLGIIIDIDMSPLRPKADNNSTAYYVKGTIIYADGSKGTLFYIKTTMIGNEPEHLLAYRRQHPTFPDETTADQFFTEEQFESYRKLGELIGEKFCEVVTDDKADNATSLYSFSELKRSLNPIVEPFKIDNVEFKFDSLKLNGAEQALQFLETVSVKTDKPVTFYPHRDEESSLGEQFHRLVQELTNNERSLLVERVRKWLKRKSHQHLLWFASEIVGYFKLSELREDLRPFSQAIMEQPHQPRFDWELNCLWAYARFNDYEQIHQLLQTTTNANTQKWLLNVYPQMVKTHCSENNQCDRFIGEVEKFLQRPSNEIEMNQQQAENVLKQLQDEKTS